MGPLLPALAAALITLPVAAQSLCGRMAFPAAAIKEFSSDFGQRGGRLHPGLDFTGTRGTPIRAAADGVVAYAGRYYGYGNMVDVTHRDGTVARYAHLATIAPGIHAGAPVAVGATLGGMGATGRASGVHLHFEVRIGGVPVDPKPWLAMASCNGAPQPDRTEEARADAAHIARRR